MRPLIQDHGDHLVHVHVFSYHSTTLCNHASNTRPIRRHEGAADCYGFSFSACYTSPRSSTSQGHDDTVPGCLWYHQEPCSLSACGQLERYVLDLQNLKPRLTSHKPFRPASDSNGSLALCTHACLMNETQRERC